jgi:hypothetical protein
MKKTKKVNLPHIIKYKENKSFEKSTSSSKKNERSSLTSVSKNMTEKIGKNKSEKYSSSSKSPTKI